MPNTIEENEELIQEFYQSPEYHKIKQLESRQTLLDIFGKSRSETIHSAMIAWLFKNEEFQRLPEPSLLFLFRLIAYNAKKQNIDITVKVDGKDIDIRQLILTNSVTVNTVDAVEIEKSVSASERNGRCDIVIECTVGLAGGEKKKIRIVIENKIDSKEHDEQCMLYADFFEDKGKKEGFQNIYVYLAPTYPKKLSSNKFIRITYQELYDSVLYPMSLYMEKYTERTWVYLKDYIDAVTTINTDNILAMSNEYNNLLVEFYRKNESIICAAIQAAGSDEAQQLVESVKVATKKYSITFPDNPPRTIEVNGHTKMAWKVLEYLASKMSQNEVIENYGYLFKGAKGPNSQYASAKGGVYFSSNEIHCRDGKVVYCSNQWFKNSSINKMEKLKKVLDDKKTGIIIQP